MDFKRRKIAVIGAGFTGSTTALMLAQKELGDIVLLNTRENPTKGKALDLLQSGSVQGLDVNFTGTTNYEQIENADLVIITAGLARTPGMSRDELVAANANIVRTISKNIAQYAPDCYIIVLSNPVDVMTYECFKATGFPKNRVMGQSGVLDTARFRTFVAQELNISAEDVTGIVMGGHGDEMVPLIRYSCAGGIPLEKLIPAERLSAIIERTRKGGGEIVNLLGNGSAYYAPSASLVLMAEAILKDKKRILPTVSYLEGEYGHRDMFLGVPAILGGNGVEKVIELDLTVEEKAALDASAQSVQHTLAATV